MKTYWIWRTSIRTVFWDIIFSFSIPAPIFCQSVVRQWTLWAIRKGNTFYTFVHTPWAAHLGNFIYFSFIPWTRKNVSAIQFFRTPFPFMKHYVNILVEKEMAIISLFVYLHKEEFMKFTMKDQNLSIIAWYISNINEENWQSHEIIDINKSEKNDKTEDVPYFLHRHELDTSPVCRIKLGTFVLAEQTEHHHEVSRGAGKQQMFLKKR